MTKAECRMTKERPRRRMPWIWEHTRPACLSLRSATTNFSLCLAIRQKLVLSRQQHQHPGRARSPEDRAPLRRDPVGQRVGMKIGVITQTKPGTIWLGGLRYSVFLARGKVVP
jgi:hypothetical protein